MRKLLIILFLLILALPVQSATMVSGRPCPGGSGATTAYCTGATTCTATNPGECDLACEDMEGTSNCDTDDNPDLTANCRNGFVATVNAGDTVNFAATAAGTYPCSKTTNTYVLDFNIAGAGATYVTKDAGAKKPIVYEQFYVYIVSESIGNAQMVVLAGGDEAANLSTSAYTIQLYQTSDTLYLRMTYRDSGASSVYLPTANGAGNTVTTGNWYLVTVKYDYTNQATEFSINGSSQGTGASVYNRQPQYFHVGDSGFDAAVNFQIDNIAIDATATQGACLN